MPRTILDILSGGQYQTSKDLPPLTSGNIMEDISSLNAFLNPPLPENVEAPGAGLLEYTGMSPVAGPKNIAQLLKILKKLAKSKGYGKWAPSGISGKKPSSLFGLSPSEEEDVLQVIADAKGSQKVTDTLEEFFKMRKNPPAVQMEDNLADLMFEATKEGKPSIKEFLSGTQAAKALPSQEKIIGDIKKSSNKFFKKFGEKEGLSGIELENKIKSEIIKKYGEDPVITLYRGVKTPYRPATYGEHTEGEIGRWWTTDIERAKGYGKTRSRGIPGMQGFPLEKGPGEVWKIEVPLSELSNQELSLMSGDFIYNEFTLSSEIQKRAKLIK